MKKYIFSFCLFIITCLSAQAQFNYRPFSVTLNTGAGFAFMDANQPDVNVNIGLSGDFHFSPFTYLSVGVNNGKFSRKSPDQYGRGFESNLTSFSGIINISLGEITQPNWKYTRGLFDNTYVGVGVGVVRSSMSNFNLVAPDGKFGRVGGVKYAGTNIFIPVNIGANIKFFDSFKELKPLSLNINYQYDFTFTENIDGYNPSFDNKFSDAFGILTFGVRYSFGSSQNYSSYR
ncbi:hypothetical protein [Solitalea canadensis]|uniref:Outer membrane protein beta-barrel domain-containing protein n=1 Tax=Solitalea canadensis (strain ATCC 29591 / DSM 3403 / JCM 21819 / LMG 8368 / NBRC 15130 / NCIMB 12057 / USAM 9D) TaxID=929556 RepID=H8KSA7_SOLCM|nr:hypothetical protein [Solitalea canadensis]AFD08015.1 hypothetical protein Solca_2996 [Solitalea canadensis DSM 3403]